MVMTSFLAQTVVRGALTTFLAVLAIEVLGMGDGGVGVLGAAIGLGGIVGALGALALGTDRRLAVVFALALFLWGAPIAVIGFVPVTAVAIGALAVVGIANALLDVSGPDAAPARHRERRPVRGVRGPRGGREHRRVGRRRSWPRCSSPRSGSSGRSCSSACCCRWSRSSAGRSCDGSTPRA